MSHKIAQHVHVFSVSQDNAADTTRKRFNHITANEAGTAICYYQFINFVCDTGGQRQPHANSPQPPPHTVTSR